MISASELDRLLLSFCDQRWRKVARVVGKTMEAIEARGVELDGSFADRLDKQLAGLVGDGQLEAKGNIKRWGYSEVRLPGGHV